MKEYKITFANTVFGEVPDREIPFIKAGESFNISEEKFRRLKSGEKMEVSCSMGHGMTGHLTYSKKDLENEVVETEVIVNTTVRKLGNRKKS